MCRSHGGAPWSGLQEAQAAARAGRAPRRCPRPLAPLQLEYFMAAACGPLGLLHAGRAAPALQWPPRASLFCGLGLCARAQSRLASRRSVSWRAAAGLAVAEKLGFQPPVSFSSAAA
jgi:hypothetical protein